MFDSELEREFVGAFEKLSTAERPIRIHKTLVNEKEGYSLQVGESLWTIEPQVDFDASMGISVKSRPDFIIRPKRTTGNQKPIAVFTDGYCYHKDIVEEDTLILSDNLRTVLSSSSSNFDINSLFQDLIFLILSGSRSLITFSE